MIKLTNVERALHLWQPWIDTLIDGRTQVNKLVHNIENWSVYAERSLRKIRLPSKLLLRIYYLSCVFSKYDEHNIYYLDQIQLPQFIYPLAERFTKTLEQVVWCHQYVRPYLDIKGTRLTPDLDNLRTRPYPPAIWRKSDIEFALEWEWHQGDGSRSIYETLRTYYAPCYMVLTDDHPLLDIATNIKRKRDDSLAIVCAQLKDQGDSYAKIGNKFGWKLQADNYGRMTRCSTARRYVMRGRVLRLENAMSFLRLVETRATPEEQRESIIELMRKAREVDQQRTPS